MTETAPNRSSLAIVGLVLAVLGLITSFIPIINNGSFILAAIAVALGILAIISVKRGKSSGMGIAVTTVVLGVLTCAVVLALQSAWTQAIDDTSSRMSGAATEELLGTEVDVQIGQLSVKTDSTYPRCSLPVTIVNLSDEEHSYSVKIEAVNGEGDRIDDDTVYASDLGAGQKQAFEAFTLVSSEDAEKLESATFKVVSISQY